jgi:hypothetical protein
MMKMSKFEPLTKYISLIKDDSFGDWVIDKENDGAPEHPTHMPYVNYSKTVDSFHEDFYKFCEANPEFEYTKYGETLKANGLKWGFDSMRSADVSKLDAKCVIALLTGAVRVERFYNGALLYFFKEGCILRWLERLKEIDEQ